MQTRSRLAALVATVVIVALPAAAFSEPGRGNQDRRGSHGRGNGHSVERREHRGFSSRENRGGHRVVRERSTYSRDRGRTARERSYSQDRRIARDRAAYAPERRVVRERTSTSRERIVRRSPVRDRSGSVRDRAYSDRTYRDRIGSTTRYRDRVGTTTRYRDRAGTTTRYRDRYAGDRYRRDGRFYGSRRYSGSRFYYSHGFYRPRYLYRSHFSLGLVIGAYPVYGYRYYDPYCGIGIASLGFYHDHCLDHAHPGAILVVDGRVGAPVATCVYDGGRWVVDDCGYDDAAYDDYDDEYYYDDSY